VTAVPVREPERDAVTQRVADQGHFRKSGTSSSSSSSKTTDLRRVPDPLVAGRTADLPSGLPGRGAGTPSILTGSPAASPGSVAWSGSALGTGAGSGCWSSIEKERHSGAGAGGVTGGAWLVSAGSGLLAGPVLPDTGLRAAELDDSELADTGLAVEGAG
jgi:hypothetical protein